MGASDVVHEARFRSAGLLQVGNPVLLRGVKIGRVEAVRLDSTARNQWVRVTLRLKGTEKLPNAPVGIISRPRCSGTGRSSSSTAATSPTIRRCAAR